jgi:hypothetical protein
MLAGLPQPGGIRQAAGMRITLSRELSLPTQTLLLVHKSHTYGLRSSLRAVTHIELLQ